MASIKRTNLGFLLAKATQRWNELMYKGFCEAGYPEVRPSYGSILVPLFEEDGLRMGELAARSRLSKQTMTTMVRLLEREKLVERRTDPEDARAGRVFLTPKSQQFRTVAEQVLSELDKEARAVAGNAAHEQSRDWLIRFIKL